MFGIHIYRRFQDLLLASRLFVCAFSEISKMRRVRSGNYYQDALFLSGGRGKPLSGGIHSGEVPLLSHFERFRHEKHCHWCTNAQERVVLVSNVCRAISNAYCTYTILMLTHAQHTCTVYIVRSSQERVAFMCTEQCAMRTSYIWYGFTCKHIDEGEQLLLNLSAWC